MLVLDIPSRELFDEETSSFIKLKECTLTLEHSLVSLSKWESKWKKPYLDKLHPKSNEEILDYIRCMTITQNIDSQVYMSLPNDILEKISAYISDPMTATTFSDKKAGGNRGETVTSELIYYWMFSLEIPIECQRWHLNRLLTLIRICNIKNGPVKNMGKRDIARQNASLNAARRKRFNSRG